MNKVFAIAYVVFKESIRNKAILSLIALSMIFVTVSLFLDPITLGETNRIVKDIGLASITFFSLLIVLLAGTRLLYQEIEKKTIYMIITKPIKKKHFIIGKFLGLLSIIYTLCIVVGGYLTLIIILVKAGFNIYILYAILLIMLQYTLLSAIAIFFSTFVTPISAGLFTLMTYIIGYLIKDLYFFIEKTNSIIIKWIIRVILYIFPNFYYTDIKLQVVNNISISFNYILFVVAYLIIYTFLFLFLSTVIFEKKEF